MPCSNCQQHGHNYVKCPSLTTDEINKIKQLKLKKKQDAIERRRLIAQRLREENERQRKIELERQRSAYIVNNPNFYELSLYFNTEADPSIINHFSYVESNTSKNIRAYPHNTIFIYPTLDVLIPNSHNAIKLLPSDHPTEPLAKIKISDYIQNIEEQREILINSYRGEQLTETIDYYKGPNNNNEQFNYYCNVDHIIVEKIIHIELKEYKIQKTDLEQWKEVGLKSNYLLKQLIKLGGRKYENLEPILDMVQDIKIPEHSAYDCEVAGIPSVLTNVT